MATEARPTPTERRIEAIHQLVVEFIDEETGLLKPGATRIGAYFKVKLLHEVGRSQRWQAVINRWADMIMESPQSGITAEPRRAYNHLRWAILQGAIYAGHEA